MNKVEKPLNEDKLNNVVIDLNAVNTGQINEGGFLRMFGWAVEKILGNMFGGSGAVPVQIRGNPAQVSSFANTLASEKRYMDSWRAYGLDDPRTYKDRAVLKKSISNFERLTGLDWPFE